MQRCSGLVAAVKMVFAVHQSDESAALQHFSTAVCPSLRAPPRPATLAPVGSGRWGKSLVFPITEYTLESVVILDTNMVSGVLYVHYRREIYLKH